MKEIKKQMDDSIATQGEEVDVTTLNPDGDVSNAETTPTGEGNAEVDWQGEIAKLRAELEETKVKSEKDVGAVKSSLQRREADLQKRYEREKADLEAEIRRLRMEKMPDDERSAYERRIEAEEREARERSIAEREARAQELEAMYNYRTLFSEAGVPVERLREAKSLEELANAGWSSMLEIIKDLRSKVADSESGKKPEAKEKPPVTKAPAVMKSTGAPPTGTTYEALVKKYGGGNEARFMELIDSGRSPRAIEELNEVLRNKSQ